MDLQGQNVGVEEELTLQFAALAPPPPKPQQPAAPARAPTRRVDHTYRDYSRLPWDKQPVSGKTGSSKFPAKLHKILSNPEFSHIITWMPHGRAWKIHNKDLLLTEVIPKFFVHSKYESFTRQLNGWGFKRLIQAGNDFNAYYHECFLQGHPHLTSFLRRVPPNQGKLLPHVEGEPNFYEIARDFPLQPPPGLRMMSYPQSAYHRMSPTNKEQLRLPMQTETSNYNEFVGMPGFNPRGLVGGYPTFSENTCQYPMQQYGSLPPQNSLYNTLLPPVPRYSGSEVSQSYHPDTTMRKVSTLSSTNEDETDETDQQMT